MEFVSAIVGHIVESLMVPIKQHMGYLISSTKYVRSMSTRMKQLDGASVDVKKHMDANNINNLEIPACVQGWLEEVEKIKEDAESISSNGNGCFNMKTRYRAGRNASKITEEIERLIKENLEIIWSDTQKPLGKVNTKRASTAAPSDGDAQNYFKSREETFKDALGFLQQDHKTQVIALCGMGGVGKTTMMEQLKKTVEDKKMFDWIVKVVVGQKTNSFSIQQAVAEYIGRPLTETIKTARAERLGIRFGEISEEGKKKILIILDDVWEKVELKDIGLSPLPNGFKLLLTSRYENICTQIAVEANSVSRVVRVDVMEEVEAHNFFCRITGVSKEYDPELNDIGGDIVRRCGFLPLAIKLIATTLKFQENFVWRNTLHRLKKNDLDKNVNEIIEISYNNLKEEEDKAIFLLCGLFPDDTNIPIEDLTRYAWGLKLLNEVPTLGDARDRTKTCVSNLKNANLLIDSDYLGCVKMHDLVLSFVLGSVSKGNHAWIINHGDISKWSSAEMSETCKRISLTCMGMSEFPRDFKYPNLSLLKLMHGDKSLKFPEDFYEKMDKLEVIAYEKMQYPLLPRSLQCSTKLRTLCLHQCLLMFDCSPIGDLLNLEVLSLADCRIQKLPSIIGNLKELKLLDLTDCFDLRIDDGVLKNLVKLEELYMRVANGMSISFTHGCHNELAERSKNLSALEFEFFINNARPKNMSFKKLERFKISMGRRLKKNEGINMHSFENTLMLVTNRYELLESRINELFQKTEVLHLEVHGMNDLEDILVESLHPPQRSFYNLRVLEVFKCVDLRHLFTVSVASGLMKLERLTISQCLVMEVLVYGENSGASVIKFQELKFLSLNELPNLVRVCNNVNVIELPQLVELRLNGLPNFTSIYPENKSATSSMSSNNSEIQPFLNKEVVIPKLEILKIDRMEKLKEIWPCQFSTGEEVNACILREIQVRSCNRLVNLFPSKPMSLLHHLVELHVHHCDSIEVLFNIDVGCVGEIEEGSSSLRRIGVQGLGKLREVWRMKGVSNSDLLISGFQSVESIQIQFCKSFRNVFTPTIANFDMSALTDVGIDCGNPWEVNCRNSELVERSQEINVAFPFHLIPTFHHLQKLVIRRCNGVEGVFEIQSASSRELATTRNNQHPLLLPYLKDLEIFGMERMTHLWKCNWNKFLTPQKHQRESSFHNLTKIALEQCKSVKYLFSPLMAKLLSNLQEIRIKYCDGIEEVVSNRDDGDEEMDTSTFSHTNTTFFPHFDVLYLFGLSHLKLIDGGGVRGGSSAISSNITITTTSINDQFKYSQVGVASWSLCQYSKKIEIYQCHALSSVIPSYAVGQLHKLEELRISWCRSMMEIFEIEGVNNDGGHSTKAGDGSDDTRTVLTIPRPANMTFLELPNLKILQIKDCDLLEHIFTSSTLESLKQLKELTVEECKAMQVIVKEDGEHTTTSKTVFFPRLKSLTLVDLPNLKGFFFGMNEFRWPLLDKVKIYGCPQMMIFTSGHSMAPKLNYIHTGLGKHSLECGLNLHLTNASHKTQFRSLSTCSSPDIIKLLQFPWSFSNLVEVDAQMHDKLLESRIIFPCNELLNLKNLEKLHVTPKYLAYRTKTEEVFEVVEGTNDDLNETQSVVIFPKLKEVTLDDVPEVRHIWKSNRWIVLNFPNLTKVSIKKCPLLGHVFTCCMVGSLLQLQELQISYCEDMEVIVKQVEDYETRANEVVFPCLKSLILYKLPHLKGFCLGREAFIWPTLDTLEIKGCPQITDFTYGRSTTPELKVIDTSFGLCYATEDPTSFIKAKQQEGFQF